MKTLLKLNCSLKIQPPIEVDVKGIEHHTQLSICALHLTVSQSICPSQAGGQVSCFTHLSKFSIRITVTRVRSTKDTLTPNPVFIHSLFQQLCLTRVWAPRIKPKLPFTKHSCVPGTVPGALHGVQMNIIPILPTGKLWLSEVKWHAQSYTAHR